MITIKLKHQKYNYEKCRGLDEIQLHSMLKFICASYDFGNISS